MTRSARVLYVAFSAVLTVVIYRLVVQGWMESILSGVLAAALAWALVAAVVVLAAVGVLGEFLPMISRSPSTAGCSRKPAISCGGADVVG